MPSRWAETAEDAAEDARRKAEKEEKKRLKAEKQRRAEEEAQRAEAEAAKANGHGDEEDTARPKKRRRLSRDEDSTTEEAPADRPLLRSNPRSWQPTRSITHFDLLNPIEEGSYGFVSRARETATNQIVAIKKLKLDPIRDGGFPVTALREIQCLNAAKHRHIVELREVVYGSTAQGGKDGDVYLIMDFHEHDLKTLQQEMESPFSPSEVKTLLLQLTSAVEFLHDHWILHRDLKTSNILLTNSGEIKLADFGLARFVPDPAPANLTQLVVTLWYRAPELLLGARVYDGSIDIWSLGCIFGELLTKRPLLQGKNEVDQLAKIFALVGPPSEETWPGFRRLPNARTLRLPPTSSTKTPRASNLPSTFPSLPPAGLALLTSCLSLNPDDRPTAKRILNSDYFHEDPRPKPKELFPTFPSKAGGVRRRRWESPGAPVRGAAPGLESGRDGVLDLSGVFG